jgi:hypothetical protein
MRDAGRRSAEGGADSVVFKTLFAAMEGSAKRSLAYSRVAALLSALEVALFTSAVLAAVAYFVLNAAYWQLAAASAALAVAALAAGRLYGYFYRRALAEFGKLELLAAVAALSAGRTDLAETMLKEKAKELKSGQALSN